MGLNQIIYRCLKELNGALDFVQTRVPKTVCQYQLSSYITTFFKIHLQQQPITRIQHNLLTNTHVITETLSTRSSSRNRGRYENCKPLVLKMIRYKVITTIVVTNLGSIRVFSLRIASTKSSEAIFPGYWPFLKSNTTLMNFWQSWIHQ